MIASLLRQGYVRTLCATVALLTLSPVDAGAQTPPSALIHYSAGETLTLHGQPYRAGQSGVAFVSLSSEYLSVAVLSGRLSAGRVKAGPGNILITPIEGQKTERFLFDAQKLSQTLPADAAPEARPLLDPIIAQQKRARFFGLIEPVGLNAQTPAPAPVESVRRSYLSQDVVVDLRRQAGGDAQKLNDLTARRFIQALASGDSATVAALLDPKPFTDATADTQAWQGARLKFAESLTARPDLVGGLAQATLSADPAQGNAWLVGRDTAPLYRLRIVDRDRAAYVAALEPIS